MSYGKKFHARTWFSTAFVITGIVFAACLMSCGSSKTEQPNLPPSRYQMTGRVVSIDKARQEVEVDAKDIPGFMGAMQMGYPVKNSNLLEPLAPEDQITADVVVKGNDMWLENIVVVKKPDDAKKPSASDTPLHAPPPPAKQQ